MRPFFNRNSLVYLALLIWLFASGSGLHGHYCFDGMEPPVSVHFDLIGDHQDPDHQNVIHKDIDSKPSLLNPLKLSNPDLYFLAALLLLVIVWPQLCGQKFHLPDIPFSRLSIVGLRPPLRAPPF